MDQALIAAATSPPASRRHVRCGGSSPSEYENAAQTCAVQYFHSARTGTGDVTKTQVDELVAFEMATRDLVGVALRSVEHAEVSLRQFRLLAVLGESGRSTSTECAKALGVVGSSVTRLADRLHAAGYLVRGADPDNRSVVTLELTAQGRKVVRQVTARRRRDLSRMLDRIDSAERAACAAVLRTLHEQVSLDDQYTSTPI